MPIDLKVSTEQSEICGQTTINKHVEGAVYFYNLLYQYKFNN